MLPIYETFYAWQGEGVHMGRAAYFIRTFGCPVKCPWCDSAGTWHPDWVPDAIERISETDLADKVLATKAEFAVITGGEPAIHDLTAMTAELAFRNMPSHIETSGGFPIRGNFTWVTLSPKWAKPPLAENLARANEIKIIVESADSIERWWRSISEFIDHQVVWLHPEWSKRNDQSVLGAINEAVKGKGRPFRVGYQMHRLYNVDALDPGSRPNVPLGGNTLLGH
jgi:organic radical activating enzyme